MNEHEFMAKLIMLNWKQTNTNNEHIKMFLKNNILMRIYILNDIAIDVKDSIFKAANYNEALDYILERSY